MKEETKNQQIPKTAKTAAGVFAATFALSTFSAATIFGIAAVALVAGLTLRKRRIQHSMHSAS